MLSPGLIFFHHNTLFDGGIIEDSAINKGIARAIDLIRKTNRIFAFFMNHEYTELQSRAFLKCYTDFDAIKFSPENPLGCFILIWQRRGNAVLTIDGLPLKIREGQIVALGFENRIDFKPANGTVILQFNREFYCVADYDKIVSCSGILFSGAKGVTALNLAERETTKLDGLFQFFKDGFERRDAMQGEMLRLLLKQLIIMLTRLAKEQWYAKLSYTETELEVVRIYNLLVDTHYRKLHKVTDYAALMNKSPKTLSNLFNLFYSKTPLQVIHERIALEAKRLFMFTNKSAKEIGYELGFDDAAKFSRFFKTQTGHYPTSFKEGLLKTTLREELVS